MKETGEQKIVKPGERNHKDPRYAWAVNQILHSNHSCDFFLDCACGCGHGTKVLSLKHPKAKVIGVDIKKQMVHFARQWWNGVNISYLVGNIQSLIFANNLFYIVVSIETIEHTLSPKESLEELSRVLKKDGIMIVSFPIVPTMKNKWHLSEVRNIKEARLLLNSAGFIIREQHILGNKKYGIFRLEKVYVD